MYICIENNKPDAIETLKQVVGDEEGIEVVGVCKAYTSRVGDGPFPTRSPNG